MRFRNVLVISTAIVVAGAAGATAAAQIGSAGITDDSLKSVDIHNTDENGTGVKLEDTSEFIQDKITQVGILRDDLNDNGDVDDDQTARLNKLEDPVLVSGADYLTTWEAHSKGETIAECPTGTKLLSGGYSMFGGFGGTHDGYDLGGLNTDVQVTVNAPYFKGEYEPVDDAGNFEADEWVVRGFNHGDTDQVVRAWVTCLAVG